MKGSSRNEEGFCPRLLNLLAEEREWFLESDEQTRGSNLHGFSSEEDKLKLSLGPPGENMNLLKNITKVSSGNPLKLGDESLLSLGNNSSLRNQNQSASVVPGGVSTWAASSSNCLHFPKPHQRLVKESPHCNTRMVGLQGSDKYTAVPNSSQKRTAPAPAPAPVVGWPPIRSFRKNIASTLSSKTCQQWLQNATEAKTSTTPTNGLYVKINMDGIPIGRKVDLSAYDCYEKLLSAVDELFRGLLAAQRQQSDASGGEKKITCLLDGSGEYTLVYHDHKGSRMVAGDVPWKMFVSTANRLRVLKTSELSSLTRNNKQGKKNVQT